MHLNTLDWRKWDEDGQGPGMDRHLQSGLEEARTTWDATSCSSNATWIPAAWRTHGRGPATRPFQQRHGQAYSRVHRRALPHPRRGWPAPQYVQAAHGHENQRVFIQKWNDDPDAGPLCPKTADYNIFFATQRIEAKDTSGDKIFAKIKDGELARDRHGHWMSGMIFSVRNFKTAPARPPALPKPSRVRVQREAKFFLSRPFDGAKYEALLKGLDVTVMTRDEVLADNEKFRIDAGYFCRDAVLVQRRMDALPHVRLGEACSCSVRAY